MIRIERGFSQIKRIKNTTYFDFKDNLLKLFLLQDAKIDKMQM